MATTPGRKNAHDYKARLVWDGNLGEGTSTYTGYGRKYRVQFDGKPELIGSADPIFRGDANVYNPEDLFVASLSSCHLLSYLALCARSKINVIAYEDDAIGTIVLRPDGGGKFETVTLRPKVTIAAGGDEKRDEGEWDEQLPHGPGGTSARSHSAGDTSAPSKGGSVNGFEPSGARWVAPPGQRLKIPNWRLSNCSLGGIGSSVPATFSNRFALAGWTRA